MDNPSQCSDCCETNNNDPLSISCFRCKRKLCATCPQSCAICGHQDVCYRCLSACPKCNKLFCLVTCQNEACATCNTLELCRHCKCDCNKATENECANCGCCNETLAPCKCNGRMLCVDCIENCWECNEILLQTK